MSAAWEPYDSLIARGLAAGESFSEITAAVLAAGRAETTRNAVIGRARRLGLDSAVKPGCGQVRVARKPAGRPPQDRATPRASVKPKRARKTQPAPAVAKGARRGDAASRPDNGRRVLAEHFRAYRAAFLPPAQPVRLADIQAGACRRPVGGGWGADLLMCGARVRSAGSYCRACARLIYAERPEGAPVLPRLAGIGTAVAAAEAEPAEGEVDLVEQFGEGA